MNFQKFFIWCAENGYTPNIATKEEYLTYHWISIPGKVEVLAVDMNDFVVDRSYLSKNSSLEKHIGRVKYRAREENKPLSLSGIYVSATEDEKANPSLGFDKWPTNETPLTKLLCLEMDGPNIYVQQKRTVHWSERHTEAMKMLWNVFDPTTPRLESYRIFTAKIWF